MNDCDTLMWFSSNYNWGFRRVVHMLNSDIAIFVDNELYAPVDYKLESVTISLKL
jgi:hypothetical protein